MFSSIFFILGFISFLILRDLEMYNIAWTVLFFISILTLMFLKIGEMIESNSNSLNNGW